MEILVTLVAPVKAGDEPEHQYEVISGLDFEQRLESPLLPQ